VRVQSESGLAPTFYEILGVAEEATSDEIRTAWRKAATKHHPDAGGRSEAFVIIQEAYDVLSDGVERRLYDQRLDAWRSELRRAQGQSSAAQSSSSAQGAAQGARSSSGAGPRSSSAGSSERPPAEDPKVVAARADAKISRVGSALKSNFVLASLLVALGWLSVLLRSKGVVTVFEPRDAKGQLALGGLPDLPPMTLSLLFNCYIYGFVAAFALRPVWRRLRVASRLVMLAGAELLLLAVAGLSEATPLSLSLAAAVAAVVAVLIVRDRRVEKLRRSMAVEKAF